MSMFPRDAEVLSTLAVVEIQIALNPTFNASKLARKVAREVIIEHFCVKKAIESDMFFEF